MSEIEARFEESQNALVVQSSDFSLRGLHDMVSKNVIDLAPKYQRRERWDTNRQSELIESFLLNIPVPPIYLSEESYGVYSIIDGKQRIGAVSDFLSNKFQLRGLSNFREINGFKFIDLPLSLKNSLEVRPFLRVITLLKQTRADLKYEVFLRLNRGGVNLNNQEIRNVAFRGNLNDAIYDEAESNDFLKKCLNIVDSKSSAYQQMLDAELIIRFLTLRDTWRDFSGSFSSSMDLFMLQHNNVSKNVAESIVLQFQSAIERVEKLWGTHSFQRWDSDRWRQQTLAGLFDAQMIAVSELSDAQFQSLIGRENEILERTKELFADKVFEESVRIATNTPSRMKHRVTKILEMLEDMA